MSDRIKSIILPIELGLMIMGLMVYFVVAKPLDYSESERRELKQKPELTMANVISAEYMNNFEDYALDHFPLRDNYRAVKALSAKYIFGKSDNNGIYIYKGYIAKQEYPVNYEMLDHALDCFNYINETYLKENDIKPYVVLIPDKAYYFNNSNILTADFDSIYNYMEEGMPYGEFVDIRNRLTLEDYYYTDTHWRQEQLKPVADIILESMNSSSDAAYVIEHLDIPFYGVYYWQSAMPLKPDEINYITNDTIESCKVVNYDTGKGKKSKVYNMKKAAGKDPYEMFLDGPSALITIENKSCTRDKTLVVFRDSFGSSIVPYFIESYSKIVLVDIRYIQPSYIGAFVDLKDSDVLFLYSQLLLNNSLSLKRE